MREGTPFKTPAGALDLNFRFRECLSFYSFVGYSWKVYANSQRQLLRFDRQGKIGPSVDPRIPEHPRLLVS